MRAGDGADDSPGSADGVDRRSRTPSTGRAELSLRYWTNVVAAGIAAGTLMGLIMHDVTGTITAVGALYGLSATWYGWAFHLWHAGVFAALYGGFFMWRRLEPFRDRRLASATIGICWGTLLWVVAAGVVMPLWLDAVGATSPGVPALEPWSGLGHVLYGGILGAGSAALHRSGGSGGG